MPSPFPGMNPYLEHPRTWVDFHNSYITYLRSAIAPLVAPAYFVQLDESIYLEPIGEDDTPLVGRGDVHLAGGGGSPVAAAAGPAVASPVRVRLPRYSEWASRSLSVRDANDRRVVTVIELLSPTNKQPGKGRAKYRRKRERLTHASVNFVELDFLRGGPRADIARLPACDYYALISRPRQRPTAHLWPVLLRQPLPPIPVPLRRKDVEPAVDLQAVLHRTYDEAGYAPRIYQRPLTPPLPPDDAAWAADIAAAATAPA